MLVRDLMSTPVVTVDADEHLRTAVAAMLEHDVGSVVLVEGESEAPVAIVTETDVLMATYKHETDLSSITAESAASSPLETVEPDRTVGDAVDRMIDARVTHLPVVDGLDVVGIVTLTDVALNYDDLRDEALSLAGRRDHWTTEEE